jgi:DNA-directed RNA polymerase subunit RPC12/RpoP
MKDIPVSKLGHSGQSGCGCLILLVGFPLLFFLSFFGCSCDNCFPIGDNKPAEITNTIEEGPTMHTVVCQGCGVEWESSSNTPMTDCYYCQETFCDEGLMIVASMAILQPSEDPKVIETLTQLEDRLFKHANTCSRCQKEIEKQFKKQGERSVK